MASEKVAAVTGAASGIGRATALALSRQGARVALCDRNAAGLAEVAKLIREQDGQARVLELDVSDQGQAARAIDGIVQDWGRLDVLVNAAGIIGSGTSRGPWSESRKRTGTASWTSTCWGRSTAPRRRRGT